jgi:hypothetical protein
LLTLPVGRLKGRETMNVATPTSVAITPNGLSNSVSAIIVSPDTSGVLAGASAWTKLVVTIRKIPVVIAISDFVIVLLRDFVMIKFPALIER